MRLFDVAVIGGGVAGSSAALTLSRNGYRVVLLERTSGAHDKVCGEFITWDALPYLKELGLDVDALGASRISRARIHSRHRTLELVLPKEARGLSRRVLDQALLGQCRDAGVEVRLGSLVTQVLEESGPMSEGCPVYRVCTDTAEHPARAVFLATGKWDLRSQSRRLGFDNQLVGIKVHLRLPGSRSERLRGQVELFGIRGGYAGLCLVEEDKTNLCFVLDKTLFKDVGGQWVGLAEHLSRENRDLGVYLSETVPLTDKPLFVSHLPYGFVVPPEASSFYRLGDQFAVFPSFAGEGIFLALLSGQQAADHFSRLKENGTARYNHEFRRRVRPKMAQARWVHGVFKRPRGLDALLLVLPRWPSLTRALMRKTRLDVMD